MKTWPEFVIDADDAHGAQSRAGGLTGWETDRVEVLSGVLNGLTLGTPIAMMVRNEDQRSDDYDEMRWFLAHGETIIIGNGSKEFRGIEPQLKEGQLVVDLVRAFGARTSDGRSYEGICW